MREKITQLTRDKACMSCHSIINPQGFALENYDAVGRWRSAKGERPVDTKSRYTTADGQSLEIRGPRDIANFAVTSPAAQGAFVSEVFHHLAKQDPAAYGSDVLDRLCGEFADNGYNMRELCVALATLIAVDGLAPTDAQGESQP
jgi:hypothetical protein